MDSVTFFPVGIVHSPHKDLVGMPVQPPSALGVAGEIEILPDGLPESLMVYRLSGLMTGLSDILSRLEQ